MTTMPAPVTPAVGRVAIVGAGPGSADLITVRGARRLAEAELVLYDALASLELRQLAPGARWFYVGKRACRQSISQDVLNRLLIKYARRGLAVVRLKCGDPYVFGRGGEEALALARAGIPFEIVPGVSAALAAPAAAGIPVTHRGLSAAVTIATGHGDDQHDWSALARLGGTLVFLMAVEHLDEIVANLLRHGRSPDEPAAIVQWATTRRQTTLAAAL